MDRDEAVLAAQLAHNLKALRRGRGWTQAELAQRVDLTPHYVALIETEQRLPTLKTLLALAKVLGVPVDRLLAAAAFSEDERSRRIARMIATASEEVQLMLEEVVDASLKGTNALLRKARRKKR